MIMNVVKKTVMGWRVTGRRSPRGCWVKLSEEGCCGLRLKWWVGSEPWRGLREVAPGRGTLPYPCQALVTPIFWCQGQISGRPCGCTCLLCRDLYGRARVWQGGVSANRGRAKLCFWKELTVLLNRENSWRGCKGTLAVMASKSRHFM